MSHGLTGAGVLALGFDETFLRMWHFYLDYSLDPPGLPPSQLLPIGDLVVEPGENGLIVRPRDGRVSRAARRRAQAAAAVCPWSPTYLRPS